VAACLVTPTRRAQNLVQANLTGGHAMELGTLIASILHFFAGMLPQLPSALAAAALVYVARPLAVGRTARPLLTLPVILTALASCAMAVLLIFALWFAAPRDVFWHLQVPLVLLPAIAVAVAVGRQGRP
jgi:hypothetical protein